MQYSTSPLEMSPKYGLSIAATDNDYVRLHQIDNIAQPQRQQFNGFLQSLFGQGITSGIGLSDHLAGYGINIPVGKIKKDGAGTHSRG
ncbi:MAG TPA: hypothetical protein VIX14_00995 [Terriglobales bacterium]